MVTNLRGNTPILEVEGLCKTYLPEGLKKGNEIKALQDVSFSVREGETLGIVGESGCGKSTLGKTVLRLVEPTAGIVRFDGTNVFGADAAEMRSLRRNMQIIFQDPYASLDPRMTVGSIIAEPLEIQGGLSAAERRRQVLELLETVGMDRSCYDRFPNEFSGGQRQRICIARALALRPRLIVCDEPVSALDVSIQSQILNLLRRLQREFSLTYLFISHDLSVIRHISDRICVMYLGRVVELGKAEEVYQNPMHPYTRCLLSAVLPPRPRSAESEDELVLGEVGLNAVGTGGCPFYNRCPQASKRCAKEEPRLTECGGRQVCCHLYA